MFHNSLSSDFHFKNANMAFLALYRAIDNTPVSENGTKRVFNIGFYLESPMDNIISISWRKFNQAYADAEWEWYLNGNRNAEKMSQLATIWNEISDEKYEVNSNYGYIWRQNNQLGYIIELLRKNPQTRQASISFFNSMDLPSYGKDVICTYAVNFKIVDGELHMSVVMRSNDLWFGFCNDQYLFSKLMKLVSDELKVPIGSYYHFTQDLHLYPRHFNKQQ